MQIWKHIVVRWLDQLTLLVFEEAVEAKATEVHWINWEPSCTVHHPHSQVLSTRSTKSLLKRGHEKANRVGIVERTIICHAEQTHTSKVHIVLYVTLSNIATFLPRKEFALARTSEWTCSVTLAREPSFPTLGGAQSDMERNPQSVLIACLNRKHHQ